MLRNEFFKRRVKYCGHVVSEHGVETDPKKTEKISTWPAPQNVEQVRQFLGFAGYYRRFVKNFSKIARPLTDLLAGSGGRLKKQAREQEPTPWRWEGEQESAFTTLKVSDITSRVGICRLQKALYSSRRCQ